MNGVSFERITGGLLFMLTVILSLTMIRSPGTTDVYIFRNWMNTVYENGLAGGYSNIILSGPEEGSGRDYPPGSFAVLYVARTLGDAVGLPPGGSFKVAILIFQLISAGLILLISRDVWVAAAFNASILLSGVCLGYMDVCFAPGLIAAFWAFQSKRNVLGTTLFLIACLIKWQPLIVAPFIAVYLFQISNLRSLRGALDKLLFWQIISLIAMTIALLGLVFGLTPLRSLQNAVGHLYLSGNALNLPWIFGCLITLVLSPSFSIQADEFPIVMAPSSLYLLPIKIMLCIVFGTLVVRAIRSDKTFQNCLLFSIVGFVSYVMWNAGVHENHWFVAVVLAFMLMLHSRTREHWEIVTIIAVMANINLFVFYGVTGTRELKSRVVGVDLSIILAMLYAVAWLVLAVYAFRVTSSRTAQQQ
jgi:hypothetical protein